MTGSIALYPEFSRRKPPFSPRTSLYRTLGKLDMIFHEAEHAQGLLAVLSSINTWANLTIDFPEAAISHLSPAAHRLAFFQQAAAEYVTRLRDAEEHLTAKDHPLLTREDLLHVYAAVTGTRAEFRSSDLWIGGSSQETAVYTAPPASILSQHIEALMQAINEGPGSDPLEKLGSIHQYAFLLLPFQKDNALWIRAWTQKVAAFWGIPSSLLLPLSYGLAQQKQVYARDLLGDLETSEPLWANRWQEICEQSLNAALHGTSGYLRLWKHLRSIQGDFGRSFVHLEKLVPHLASHPHTTLAEIAEVTSLTKPNASILLERCEKTGLLAKVTFDARNKIYVSPPMLEMLGEGG
ncbi:hypothetical protein COW46_05500 [Candidatus Gracilibacteria bacterium CG17_big_fil_post_rev_8_21_14_2_50_48_13]|nr:MAG: hypothetical protein COW46_05500 [Candidatus Gracilibacteria bacterium CG17_big_fil_post_rev_8_21_14_2_50_48_13]